MEKVSIIIPAYNASKFIGEAVKSVENQNYENYEILVVNDCSKDNTAEIVEKLSNSNPKIKLINNCNNSGAALSRNAGIKNATGRFIAFLDADDVWVEEKLNKQINFMLKNGVSFSFTGYQFSNSKAEPTGKKVFVPTKLTYKDLLKNTTIFTSTVIFDMNQLKEDDILMPVLKSGQDVATWLNVLKKVEYAYGLNEILSMYRRTRGTLSSNKLKRLKVIWGIYENQKINKFYRLYCVPFWAFNAIKRRI